MTQKVSFLHIAKNQAHEIKKYCPWFKKIMGNEIQNYGQRFLKLSATFSDATGNVLSMRQIL